MILTCATREAFFSSSEFIFLLHFITASIFNMCGSNFHNQANGTMVRPKNIIVDKRFFDPPLIDNIFGNKKIIDAPPDVALPCLESIRPPRIFYGIRIKISEGVHIAVFNNPIEPVALDPQTT